MRGKKIFVLAAMMLLALSAVTYAVSDTSEIVLGPVEQKEQTESMLSTNNQLYANGGHDGAYLHLGVMRASVVPKQ
jgi:predicted acyltransferase